MSRLTRDGTAEPVSRDQILRRERGQGNINFPCSAEHEQGNINFPCSAEHEQDWQPHPVDAYSCYVCDHTLDTYNTNRTELAPSEGHSSVMFWVDGPVPTLLCP